jgi:neutral ceramidase
LKYAAVVADFKNTTLDVPTTAIKIDQFVWVTFPGEMFHEIGKNIKLSTRSKFPFIVGYCNGALGYLPTQQAHSEGGYEPWATQFDPVAEKIYLRGVQSLLPELN